MLWFKALHIIAVVAWFAGLFYLPRLFVYHAVATDTISLERFKVMERRLYYGIMWPAGVLTTVFGLSVLSYASEYYLHQSWLHWKLFFVLCIWGYHLYCGHLLKRFAAEINRFSSGFYRAFNEVPTLLLIIVVILVIVKP
jgi:putative membrane protein